VCTEPFVQMAKITAKGRGIPDLELVVVPHPLGTRPSEELDELGKVVAARVLELLGDR
jgi:hypothetical protein